MGKSHRLQNKTIRQKFLVIVFALIVVMSIGFVTIFIYANNSYQNQKIELRQIQEKTELVNKLESGFNEMFFRARGYYAFQNNNELELLNESLKELEDTLELYSKLDLTGKEQQLHKGFADFYDNYKNNILPVAIKLVETNDYEGLQELSNDGTNELVNDIVSYAKDYRQSTENEAYAIYNRMVEQLYWFSIITLVLSILILLTISFIMWRVLENIIRPIENLTSASDAIASGQSFELNTLVKRNDEIGVLSKSFLLMSKSIQDKEEVLMAQNEELERSRQLNKDIFDNVNEGIQLVSVSGDIVLVNESLCKIVHTADWLLSNTITKNTWMKHFIETCDQSDELIVFFNQSVSEVYTDTRKIRYSITQDSQKFIEMYATSVFEEDEKVGTLFVHRDITKQYEVDLMKSELVSTVSHELRTPLSSVLGFTELMLYKNLKPERQKKYLETIHKEATRLTNLINDFLDLQRMESGKQQYNMKALAFNEFSTEIINQYRYETKHNVYLIDKAKNVEVKADSERMLQVFINLIGNAIKFSPAGGDIIVTLENINNMLQVSIKDSGIGIPKDEVNNLFQKFKRVDNSSQRKIGGTGLGLVISKEIINRHEGSIWIESEEGKGTTLFFNIPLINTALSLASSS